MGHLIKFDHKLSELKMKMDNLKLDQTKVPSRVLPIRDSEQSLGHPN